MAETKTDGLGGIMMWGCLSGETTGLRARLILIIKYSMKPCRDCKALRNTSVRLYITLTFFFTITGHYPVVAHSLICSIDVSFIYWSAIDDG